MCLERIGSMEAEERRAQSVLLSSFVAARQKCQEKKNLI